MQSMTQRRLLRAALFSAVLWASAGGAVSLEDARKCLAMHQDSMRLACYDAIFEQLDAPQSAAPHPAASRPVESEASPQVAAQPASHAQPSDATRNTEGERRGFRLPRLWSRGEGGEGGDDAYSAVVVARYPLAHQRWLLRTDGYELFESYEAQDWVPEVGERVTIDPATVGAGFTLRGERGGARMKRLACDGSSRRKETRRKCELLLRE